MVYAGDIDSYFSTLIIERFILFSKLKLETIKFSCLIQPLGRIPHSKVVLNLILRIILRANPL